MVLITDLLADYCLARESKVAAPGRIAAALIPLIGYWKGLYAGRVTRQSCEEYVKWRSRSNGTARRELGVLRAAINHAHMEGLLSRSVPVHLPERPEPRQRWLTKREAGRLLREAGRSAHAKHYLPLFIRIGLHTGQRKEAILSLRWDQVDFNGKWIDWNPVGRRRTKKQRPRSRIPSKLMRTLRIERERSCCDYVIHNGGERILDVKGSFGTACKRAGLTDVSPHVLRHTRATWGMQGGANPHGLAGFLGMSRETLESTYGHHHPDYQRHAAEAY